MEIMRHQQPLLRHMAAVLPFPLLSVIGTMIFQSFGSLSRSSGVSEQLDRHLREARWDGLQDYTYFVPLSEQKKLITVPTIEKIIIDGHPNVKASEARTYAERTESSAKKLFAILALHRKGAAICSLLDSGICDQNLPFRAKRQGGQWSLWRKNPDQRIQAFEGWENKEIEDFDRTQWWMLSPVFDKKRLDCRDLGDQEILPFSRIAEHENEAAEKDEKIPHMKIGGYSEVNAYRIHPAHHNFWDSAQSLPLVRNRMISLKSITNGMQESQPLIADKKLLSNDRIEFLKEKTILVALGPQNHLHLIQLLASYRKKNSYHLIFPCADSNLRGYWKKNAMPNFDKETVLWSIKQMSGIADALCHIHRFRVKRELNVENKLRTPVSGGKLSVKAGEEKFGRHGDIKPENLLYFKDSNVLKITDFGLGRFHGRDSRSGIDPRKVVGSLTCEPPECTIGRPVSRAYDIWSLGCLFLEFVTWLLKGEEQISEFADARGGGAGPLSENHGDQFFVVTAEKNDAKVREAVIDWVDGLHAHENCSEMIHELLDFIMRAMLKTNPAERTEAQELKEKMEKLVQKAESSDAYLIGGNPRPLRTPSAIRKPS
jgi:serine/threonine protein kinase